MNFAICTEFLRSYHEKKLYFLNPCWSSRLLRTEWRSRLCSGLCSSRDSHLDVFPSSRNGALDVLEIQSNRIARNCGHRYHLRGIRSTDSTYRNKLKATRHHRTIAHRCPKVTHSLPSLPLTKNNSLNRPRGHKNHLLPFSHFPPHNKPLSPHRP